jgi:hypothetical protein
MWGPVATEAAGGAYGDVALHLQELFLESPDVGQFPVDLAKYSGSRLSSPGCEIFCGSR